MFFHADGTPITPGFEALVFKASRGIEDIYELTLIRNDGSRFPALLSVTALRDASDVIIGYLQLLHELPAGLSEWAVHPGPGVTGAVVSLTVYEPAF